MRTKHEILEPCHMSILKTPDKDLEMLRREYLLLEVLIDIRDTIVNIFGVLSAYYEDGITPK